MKCPFCGREPFQVIVVTTEVAGGEVYTFDNKAICEVIGGEKEVTSVTCLNCEKTLPEDMMRNLIYR